MDLAAVYEHLTAKPGATEGFPFGPQALVFKVRGKMFALLAPEAIPPSVSLKCDPEEAGRLREHYDAVRPGYHLNKKHWNTVLLDGRVPPEEVRAMLDASYALVVAGLKKADRDALRDAAGH